MIKLKNIKDNISSYLEFNVDDLLNAGDFVYIFGGAVRDSLANQEIHDVDVMVLPNSMKACINVLTQRGFIRDPDMIKLDLNSMYKKINAINQPLTFIKISNFRIIKVQFIRPRIDKDTKPYNRFFELLNNVDISCCGVSINSYKLTEHVNGAITHCFNKVFTVNNNAFMLTDRISMRTHKLLKRGWELTKEDNPKDELSCKQIIDI